MTSWLYIAPGRPPGTLSIFTLALPTLNVINAARPLWQTLYNQSGFPALWFNFLTSLNYMVYLNCCHQHVRFHQHFGLLYGLAHCLSYYSLVIHSNGLHFPSCQALLDSVIWYSTLSRACFRWISGGCSVMHFLLAAVSLDSKGQPCLHPSLLRLGMLLKFWGWGCSFYFLTPNF